MPHAEFISHRLTAGTEMLVCKASCGRLYRLICGLAVFTVKGPARCSYRGPLTHYAIHEKHVTLWQAGAAAEHNVICVSS